MVSALSLRGKQAVLIDRSRLGKIENFVINRITNDVDLVVFPPIPPKLIRTHAGNVVGMMAAQAVGRMKDVLPVGFFGAMTDSIGGPIGGVVATDAKRRIRIVEESYYLIPTRFIANIGSDSIDLKLTSEECKDWFVTPAAPAEIYTAFLDSSYYDRQQRSVEITVGLPSAIDTISTDSDGQEFVIKDLHIDIRTGKGSFQPTEDVS